MAARSSTCCDTVKGTMPERRCRGSNTETHPQVPEPDLQQIPELRARREARSRLGLYFHIVGLESIPDSSLLGDSNAAKRDETSGPVQPPPKRLNMKMEIGHLAEDGLALFFNLSDPSRNS